MRYGLLTASCMVATALIGAAPAYATPPHSFECTDTGATNYPGNSGTSPGSIFNEPGVNTISGGKGNQAYNNAGAPSQYDTACAKVTAAGSGTPFPTTPATTDVTNNSKATRALLGVTHQPSGPK